MINMLNIFKNNKGFSVIELILAVAIAGLVFGMINSSILGTFRMWKQSQDNNRVKLAQFALERMVTDIRMSNREDIIISPNRIEFKKGEDTIAFTYNDDRNILIKQTLNKSTEEWMSEFLLRNVYMISFAENEDNNEYLHEVIKIVLVIYDKNNNLKTVQTEVVPRN
ncbi:MAG: PilW family protein [bacterium]